MARIRCLSRLETGRSIREAVRKYVDGVGRENIMVGITADNSLEGRSPTEIASRKGKTVEDTAIELELSGIKDLSSILNPWFGWRVLHLLVNGEIALDRDRWTSELHGRVLRR